MPLRLLHLSDIHFGDEHPQALAAADAYVRAATFDLIVITGDITQFGRRSEFSAAGQWINSLPQPRLVTPGNHDTPWMGLLERVVMPFSRFEKIVGPSRWAEFETRGLIVRSFNSARGWQIRLNWSKGAVSRRSIDNSVAAMEAAPSDAVRVIACHHPLIDVPGGPMTGRVRGGRRGAEHLVRARADIVLTGHLHAPFVQPLPFGDGRTWAVGASTLSQRHRGAAPGFNSIDIGGDQLTVTALGWTGEALEVQEVWNVQLRPRLTTIVAEPAGRG